MHIHRLRGSVKLQADRSLFTTTPVGNTAVAGTC